MEIRELREVVSAKWHMWNEQFYMHSRLLRELQIGDFLKIQNQDGHYVTYKDACSNKINNNERTHLFGIIYLSHFIRNGCERVTKGVCKGFVWEVSWRLNRDWNILTPCSSSFSSTSFSFCWTAQPGALRVQPSVESWFSLPRTAITDSKLTELPVPLGYIIVGPTPASCERRISIQFNPSTVKVIPWYLRPDAPIPRSTAGSEVNMLQCRWTKTGRVLETVS